VTEGKVIPEGSLVMGAPGKVVRQLDPAAVLALQSSALHYQKNALRFRQNLRAL
jgi:carbonic anhydrase/acetyltransferase-like protein (isoleucine patch superfamily)